MATIENTKKVWHYLKENPKPSITNIALTVGIHPYQTREIVGLLEFLKLVEIDEVGKARYVRAVRENVQDSTC